MARAAALIASLALALALAWPAARARAETIRLGSEVPSLADALARASDGDEIVVPAGRWEGVARIERSVTIRGEEGAVLDGAGHGTVLTVLAPDVTLRGLEIRGSGNAMSNPDTNVDACVWMAPTALRAQVLDNALPDCLFGIYVQRAHETVVAGNTVHGRPELREADRGNGIHVFDADRVTVRDNVIEGTRDGLYVAAADDCHFERNMIRRVRYAVHYMWSHRNVLRENETTDSLAGFALMQSNDLLVEHNRIARNRRAGLLLRDGQTSVYRHNEIVANGSGVFLYNSLRERLEENLIAHNDVGLRIWGAMVVECVFSRNSLVGNAQQIFYFGTRDTTWGRADPGNHYSDYLGWDQDDDGVGERPYRVDSFTATLLHRFPAAVLLLRSPALELLSHLQQNLPMFRVHTVTDHGPFVAPTRSLDELRGLEPEGWRERAREGSDGDADLTALPM
jgi:nitrous oxidase accessory protein